jgi:hypothetical protein
VIGSVVWLCTATISRPGSGTQLVISGWRPCDASLRRRPLRRRRDRRAAITAMRGMAVGVKHRGQPPEERDHCDDGDDDGSQARSCHVIPSLRSEPAGRDRGCRRAPPAAQARHTVGPQPGAAAVPKPPDPVSRRLPGDRLAVSRPVYGLCTAPFLPGRFISAVPACGSGRRRTRGRRPHPHQTGMGGRS